jgi:hypothetical protein
MGTEWLRDRVAGFRDLSKAELQAISDFSLLWSLFEARLLDRAGSAKAICDAVKHWKGMGALDDDPYGPQFKYFQNRYYAEGAFTHHFYGLLLRPNDREQLLRNAFDGSDDTPFARAAAVFIVIYRFRNNLFHGAKWDYYLAEQLGNFTHANRALMTALDRHAQL